MPRRPRLFLPEQPQHLVVRGHNRDPVLARHEDFRFLYVCLREAAGRFGLAVHAWVFMHNHLHLLATPADAEALPRTMQSVGRRYAHYFNRTYHRSGALWEGRYKSALVDTERYLLSCYRYIELNPVRAGVVRRPEDYPYSSYHANALGKSDRLVTPHGVYLDLVGGSGRCRERCRSREEVTRPGETPGPGQNLEGVESTTATPTPGEGATPGEGGPARYRALFETELSRRELTDIRRGTRRELGIGQAEFLLRVARLAD